MGRQLNFQLIANRGQKGGGRKEEEGRGEGVYIDAGYEKCIAEAIHQYSFPLSLYRDRVQSRKENYRTVIFPSFLFPDNRISLGEPLKPVAPALI